MPTPVAIVVITRNRRDELTANLERLRQLPERPPITVVDNASTDGTAAAVASRHPDVDLVALDHNAGACARNLALQRVDAPYVAFADDDTWWEPGALTCAADVLDGHPSVAVVTARIVMEPTGRDDVIVPELRHSPLPRHGLPFPRLGSFLAGASVVRRQAVLDAGGFSARLHFGGEEELLAMDLAAAGWDLVYVDDAVVHHQPSTARDPHARRQRGIRNTLWTTWLRRPPRAALRRTAWLVAGAPHDAVTARGVAEAVAGLPWVLRERRAVPAEVEADLLLLEDAQRHSEARRYVS